MPVIRQTIALIGASALRPMIGVLIFPLLAAYYPPEIFGLLASCMALIAVVGGSANFRFDYAASVAQEHHLASVVVAGCVTSLIIGLVTACIVPLIPVFSQVKYIGLCCGIAVTSLGVADLARHALLRKERISDVARAQAVQSLLEPTAQLLIAVLFTVSVGLVAGYTIAAVLFAALLARKAWGRGFAGREVAQGWRHYLRFPLYSLPASVVNKIGTHGALLGLGIVYGLEVMGAYALAQRVIGGPMFVISGAVGQAYLSQATRNANPARLFAVCVASLVGVGIVLVVFTHEILLPWVLTILDDQWAENMEIVFWFAVLFLCQFIVVPISQTLNIYQKQRWQLSWDILRALVIVATLIWFEVAAIKAVDAAMIYAVSMAICYILLFVICVSTVARQKIT